MEDNDDDIHSIDPRELLPAAVQQRSPMVDEEGMLGVARQDFLGKIAHFPEGEFKGQIGTINGTIEGTHYLMSVVDLQRRPTGQQDRVYARPVNQEILKIMRIEALEKEREQQQNEAAAVTATATQVEKSSKRVVKKRTPYEIEESEAPPRKQQNSSSSSSSRNRQQSSSSSSNTNGRSSRGQHGSTKAVARVESEPGWAGNNIQFRMLDAKSNDPQQVYRPRAGMSSFIKAINHYDDDDMDDDDDNDSDVAVEQYDRRDGRVLLRCRSIANASKRTNIPATRVEQLCETDYSYLERHDPSAAAKRRKIAGNNGEGNLLWRYCTEGNLNPFTLSSQAHSFNMPSYNTTCFITPFRSHVLLIVILTLTLLFVLRSS